MIKDPHGAIIRGDLSEMKLSLVFTGDEFADGAAHIRKVLMQEKIPAAFFLTGNFYKMKEHRSVIRKLKKDGHYLGAHSDKHLLYADWTKRDSLLVTETQFKEDLAANYDKMAEFGVKKEDAVFFLPPYEWYNKRIAEWTGDMGLTLINFSPGTRSTADYTYPEMGGSYRPSDEIYRSIIDRAESDPHGLNGFILLLHIGTDPRRTDKLYLRLGELIGELRSMGYEFTSLKQLLDQ